MLRIYSLSLFVVFFLGACNPFYVMRAAYEESIILLSREDIPDVISDPQIDIAERKKLQTVLDAREFARSIGLEPGESFTKFTRVDKDVLVWVLLGAKPDAFELHTWWYPIVGSIPYHGYFDKEDALDAAKDLEEQGFETWVRGSEAFSTLGWFNDPVLSTTLRHDRTRIANTVLHESFHSTVWIPGHVDFNESLANFVGFQASIEFFEQHAANCLDAECERRTEALLMTARQRLEQELELAAVISSLHEALEKLYSSELTKEEKMHKRSLIFDEAMSGLRKKYPEMKILKKVNNAEIMQLKLYLTRLDLFQRIFLNCGSNWNSFIELAKKVRESVKEEGSQDPFLLIEKLDKEVCGV